MAVDPDISIVEVHLADGTVIAGEPSEEQLQEADEVFYSVSYGGGETFYRWISGPYEDIGDVYEAIFDTENSYTETT
jgi:hypothetical protein